MKRFWPLMTQSSPCFTARVDAPKKCRSSSGIGQSLGRMNLTLQQGYDDFLLQFFRTEPDDGVADNIGADSP